MERNLLFMENPINLYISKLEVGGPLAWLAVLFGALEGNKKRVNDYERVPRFHHRSRKSIKCPEMYVDQKRNDIESEGIFHHIMLEVGIFCSPVFLQFSNCAKKLHLLIQFSFQKN